MFLGSLLLFLFAAAALTEELGTRSLFSWEVKLLKNFQFDFSSSLSKHTFFRGKDYFSSTSRRRVVVLG